MNVLQYEDSRYRKKQEQIEKDKFAIAFAEWAIDYSFNQMYSVDLKELLEEFKKEKGL